MQSNIKFVVLGAVLGIILNGCSHSKTQETHQTITLMDHMGAHRYPVSTTVTLAQRFFDQGLILSFGFNHAEAARSFRQAYQLDSDCSMCYWGEALVLGPNINAPMDVSRMPQAHALTEHALALSETASKSEQALISALAKRYQQQRLEDRSSLDVAYADAMREVYEQFPDDALIAALFAESLMDLHPWDFWTTTGKAKPWTAEIVTVLEHALELDIKSPLANHLYIHILEASPFVSKALPSAERLPALVPGSGHLVHMPPHIYIRTGRYKDAVVANQQAVKADNHYLGHEHEESLYTLAYVPHNHHFLWAAAIKIGRKALAIEAADQTASYVRPEMMREPDISGTMQHFSAIPIYTQALFGEWSAILERTKPANDLLYLNAVWHYARGMAYLRQDQLVKANIELAQLDKIIADPTIANLTVFDINPVSTILQIGSNLLQAEMAAVAKDFDQAIEFGEIAVTLEDGLHYTEPKDWYLPPRQVLAAILMEAGLPQRAEQVYRQDLVSHPQNGWSLWGLSKSLESQGHLQQAKQVFAQFTGVWSEADIFLTNSRF